MPNNTVFERAGTTSMCTVLKPVLAGPCFPYGGQPYPQGPSLWRTGDRKMANWETPAALQGYLQA